MKLFDSYTIQLSSFFSPILCIIIGIVGYQIIKRAINHIAEGKKKLRKKHHQKRIETIKTLLLNLIKYLIIIIVIISFLPSFGVNIKALATGIGVTAAILGLALQDIAKDFLAGIFIIAEDQYEIGDTIEINGFRGEVIFVGLRSTRVRDYKGATQIIANHNITEVINYNLHNSLAVVDINVSYEHDPQKVKKVLEEMAESLKGKIPKTKGPIQVWGIQELDSISVKYRVSVETTALENFSVERKLREEIKQTFDKNKIKYPSTQIEVYKSDKQ